MTNLLRLTVIYHETIDSQARSFTTPANSSLTFRDFLTRFKRLTLLRDFRRSMKTCEMNYLIVFFKSYLVLFLTFISGTPISCFTTTYLGIFGNCSRDFWSFISESPASQARQCPNSIRGGIAESAQTKIGCVKSFAVKFF